MKTKLKNIAKVIVIKILTIEAKLVLKKYKPKIVGVTGSVGKTSTKDAIYTALLPFFHVRKTSKSYNSDIGIPLTILGLPNGWNDMSVWLKNIYAGFILVIKKKSYPEWLVLEIGADHPGEIEELMSWIHPDISVITRIGDVPVHVEFYRSVKDVIKEKSYLARGLKPEGTLIVNADDADVITFKEYTKAKTLSFGIKEKADFCGSFIQALFDDKENPNKVTGMSFKVDTDGCSIPMILHGVLGTQHVYPILAAFAVVKSLDLDLLKASEAFADYEYPRGRMNIVEGSNNTTIIDDTYNSSPVAMEEAFNFIKDIKCEGRKIAILGDMLELGIYSHDEHLRLGEIAGKIFDCVALVGVRAGNMKEGLESVKFNEENIFIFQNSVEAGEEMKKIVREGDLVFIKGSQGMRMERVVEKIMNEPKQKDKLLVRQEREWMGR